MWHPFERVSVSGWIARVVIQGLYVLALWAIDIPAEQILLLGLASFALSFFRLWVLLHLLAFALLGMLLLLVTRRDG